MAYPRQILRYKHRFTAQAQAFEKITIEPARSADPRNDVLEVQTLRRLEFAQG
jgi:hypothetical protein